MSSTGQAGFPQIGTDFTKVTLNPDGSYNSTLEIPWYRFLIALWRLVGGSQIPILKAMYFLLQGPQSIEAFSTSSNTPVGFLRLKDQPGAAEIPQTLTTSPFTFASPGDGFFVAFSCEVEVKRSGSYYKVSLTGAAVPLMKDDGIRLTWTGPTPVAVWFPSG